jgi:uncharacterized membrane protein YeaQ/YmgE (transglycosylase-associated protein family)
MPRADGWMSKLSRTLLLLGVWLLGGAAIGWIAAAIIHEHGSAIFFFVGIFIGLIGGLCNALYFLVRRRKSQMVENNGI